MQHPEELKKSELSKIATYELYKHPFERKWKLGKVVKFEGHEGELCLRGTIYYGNKKAIEWSDDFNGGPTRIQQLDDALCQIFSQNVAGGGGVGGIEDGVYLMAREWLAVNELRKAARRYIVYRRYADSYERGVWTTLRKTKENAARVADLVARGHAYTPKDLEEAL